MDLETLKFSLNLEHLKFAVPIIAFAIVLCFYLSEVRHTSRLYDVIDGAQQIARECIAHGQSRVDTLEAEVNAALFLSNVSSTERIADQ